MVPISIILAFKFRVFQHPLHQEVKMAVLSLLDHLVNGCGFNYLHKEFIWKCDDIFVIPFPIIEVWSSRERVCSILSPCYVLQFKWKLSQIGDASCNMSVNLLGLVIVL